MADRGRQHGESARPDTTHHWGELAAYLTRKLGDAELAAELAQEAYARLTAVPANTVILNPRAYLFATARTLIVDHWRSNAARGRPADPASLELAADPAPSAEAALQSREELEALLDAVEALPPRTREVFRLHKFEHVSYADIAKRLHISANTVTVHMTRALLALRAARARHRRAD